MSDQGTSWSVDQGTRAADHEDPMMHRTHHLTADQAGQQEADHEWPIMEDMDDQAQDDHVSDSDVSDQQWYRMIVFHMIDGVQHKIEDVPEDTLNSIFEWLAKPFEASACKIELPPQDDLEQTLMIMRDKIISIETYSSPMGGEGPP